MNDKIIKLLRLADSPNDYEAISAYRHARALMDRSGVGWTDMIQNTSVKSDLAFLMQQKLRLQQECYRLQDEISIHTNYLETLKQKVATAEGVKEGYSDKSHVDKKDIDDAFVKIFNALNLYGPKKNDFIQSLKDQWEEKGWLSPKQLSRLRENFIRYTGFEPAW